MIFDWGASAVDVSLLTIGDGVFEVKQLLQTFNLEEKILITDSELLR